MCRIADARIPLRTDRHEVWALSWEMEDWRWKLGVHRSEKERRMARTFEDLDCWKTARLLVNHIYSMTRKGDLSKDFGLSGQIQRAGVSVMTNVAEGFERVHVPEKLQFYNVA